MKRMLAVAAIGALLGVGCVGSAGEPRPDGRFEELFGEIVDVVCLNDLDFVVSVRTGEETVHLHAGLDTYLSVGGVVMESRELRDYVGFFATVLHQEGTAGRRNARFIGVESWPSRKRA